MCLQRLRKVRGESGNEAEAVETESLRGVRNPASTGLSVLKGRVREVPS